MYELVNVKGNTYYINCPSKIGLYLNDDNSVYVIDSGNDKDAGKKIKRILDENSWSLRAIINTHSHADHIGGNKFLQEKTSCEIYAKGIEKHFTLSPILEPAFLFGGFPYKDLLHKFLYAEQSLCRDICDLSLPCGFEIVDLSGHSFDMIGILTPDNVLFAADSVSSQATLEKYGIGYIYDVENYIITLDKLNEISADYFVPSHADVTDDITGITEVNRKSVLSVCENILSILESPMTFEELLCVVFDKYSLTMTHQQYVLIGSTVKSYLSYLMNRGEIDSCFENNKMLWTQKKTV